MTNHHNIAQRIINKAEASGFMLASAESCTGGMIAAALTDIAGSSVAVDRGFVTYSNAAKTAMLGVAADTINRHGAVSYDVVLAMAEGAVNQISGENGVAVSVSGVAGPGGGSAEKPVGLVWFGLAINAGGNIDCLSVKMQFEGDRQDVRLQATGFALELIDQALDDVSNTVV